MPDTGDVRYLVLADHAVPYLLARVRWPDVAQAISASNPDWLDDQGLFDLPYDPSAVTVSFAQAASVAAGWGRQLQPGAADGVPSYIRRMPANWSDLSPSETRAWGIEFAGARRVSARRVRGLRWSGAKTGVSSAVAQANGHAGELAGAGVGPGAGVGSGVGYGRSEVVDVASGSRSVATERRGRERVRVNGRAHIRSGPSTIPAGLVDLSEGGVGCVLPEAAPLVAPGATLSGPFLLEAEVITSRICLDTAGRITWHRSIGASAHFGIAFVELAYGETEGVRRLLAAARSRGGNR